MDSILAAKQNYNGGIIFVSYFISVAGALTTLELLTRRTHIRGYYNWFLLSAAAFSMGAVSIWSMHFVGNNSLTLVIQDTSYQLSYTAGYTFGSLLVAIACMFLAFVFVGITEEAHVKRIIPSGIFAGLGIVCMHYMGQFAVDYFVLVYKTGYIIGAAVIAMSAATTALYIFFKLRERWMNLWYIRLVCAIIMALAVTGMHYTALVGTIFYKPNYSGPPPVPKLQTPALIGIISAIIVSACVGLLYISIKTGIKNLPLYTKNTNKRLILDVVLFDPIGRILVKTDGTLPMVEIVHNLELNETKQEFSTSHPLFFRLFQASIDKAMLRYQQDKRPSGLSTTSTVEIYDTIEKKFLDGARDLREELRFTHFGDLGILSDIVVTTDTIAKASTFSKRPQLFKKSSSYINKKNSNRSTAEIDITSSNPPTPSDDEDDVYYAGKKKKKMNRKSKSAWSVKRSFADDEETAIESFGKRSSGSTTIAGHRSSSEETHPEDIKSATDRLSVEDSDGEDKHIFLVRKLVQNHDVSRLLSQGYRFAEPIFIAKTMAAKLRIPTDWMRQHFMDMQQMTDSICALTQHDWAPSTIAPAPNPTEFKASTTSTVYVGAFVLIDETQELTNSHIVIDKTRQFTFPLQQLIYDHDAPTHLSHDEINFLLGLQGQSLFDIASLDFKTDTESNQQFMLALQSAARSLLDSTSYSKALYQQSKLHATVLDLPPFVISTGPCQLIVFKSFVNTPGAIAAVNHTFTESMKCIPLEVYKPLCGYITDEASRIYLSSVHMQTPPTYLIQQQMYRQQTTSYDPKRIYSSSGEEDIQMGAVSAEQISDFPSPSSPTSAIYDPFSLPPPPRAKRHRFKLTTTILNSAPFDISNIQKQPATRAKSIHALQLAPLTVLATQERYWWINSIVEETIHSNMV